MKSTLRTLIVGFSLMVLVPAALVPGTGAALAADEAPATKDVVRPEVGKPLRAAQELMAAKKPKDALAKIDEADAVTEKTVYESYVIARNRVAAAVADGQVALAAKSFEAAIAFERLTAKEFLEISRVLAGQFYSKSDYPNASRWAVRYLENGGTDGQIKLLLAQSYYLLNDLAKAANVLQEINHADEAAGRVTAESALQLLANCELKLHHNVSMVVALEKLVVHYPKKDYWNDLIRNIQRNPEFPERLALDTYRLQRYAGALDNADEFVEMAGLSIQAGFPVEAKQVLDQGYADKFLGSGADQPKHKKLLDQAIKAAADDLKMLAQDEQRAIAAKTGTALVNTGFNSVLHGQFDRGLALIEKGIAKGGFKFPEDAKLKLAMAYHYAGQKDKAVQAFKSISGKDSTSDLARLWVVRLSQG